LQVSIFLEAGMKFLNKKTFLGALVGGAAMLAASAASALPALQLGNGGGASFDAATQTWMYSSNPFSLLALANSNKFGTSGGPTAFLVVAAQPKTMNMGDLFDVTVEANGSVLSLYQSGNGTPPITDPNALAPHSIFDTYYEVYMFDFDGGLVPIFDTQPGQTGTGTGYSELLDITVNSRDPLVDSLHLDLFTMDGQGQVTYFAPYSHDVEWHDVVEPISLGAFGLALAGFGLVARRRR
jgi:hypothetical protein